MFMCYPHKTPDSRLRGSDEQKQLRAVCNFHHPAALCSSTRLNAECSPASGLSFPVEKYTTPVPAFRSTHNPASRP